jgi:molybdopterin-guanine dinucleotide biosynthesis protein B
VKSPPVLAFSGASGSGKTTLLLRLIPALRARGLTVAALKHSGHVHPFDRPGKDSARLRRAGAVAVALSGPREVAYFGPPRHAVAELVALLPPCDLVLAEGFKGERLPRVEVHREAIDRQFLCARDPDVLAVVSDVEPPYPIPWFTAGEIEALAERVARFAEEGERALALRKKRAHRTARRGDELRENVMARTTTKGTGGRRRSAAARGTTRRSAGSRGKARGGAATVREAGRKGGRRTLERRGPEFYSRIGRKGGKSSGGSRRAAAAARAGRTSRGKGGSRGSRAR